MRLHDRYSSHERLDPRRRPRTRGNRDRHFVTMFAPASPIGTALAHIGFQLRVLREQLLGR